MRWRACLFLLPARCWLSLLSCWFAYDRMPVCAGHRKKGPGGVNARPWGFEDYGNGDGDAERVSGFGRGVESGSVTELDGWLLVGRWSRVGEMYSN